MDVYILPEAKTLIFLIFDTVKYKKLCTAGRGCVRASVTFFPPFDFHLLSLVFKKTAYRFFMFEMLAFSY